jgi:hypothetical protein
MSTATAQPRTAEDWVAGFAAGWAEPTDADSFCDHFEPLLADEIRLVQPQLPTVVGKRAFREHFARVLGDLRGRRLRRADDPRPLGLAPGGAADGRPDHAP